MKLRDALPGVASPNPSVPLPNLAVARRAMPSRQRRPPIPPPVAVWGDGRVVWVQPEDVPDFPDVDE
jgi:hypothetical protein